MKIKLELRQPQFKCSGRDDVTCNYRGKILEEHDDWYLIQFKYNGELLNEKYDKVGGFNNPELKDIKLKQDYEQIVQRSHQGTWGGSDL